MDHDSSPTPQDECERSPPLRARSAAAAPRAEARAPQLRRPPPRDKQPVVRNGLPKKSLCRQILPLQAVSPARPMDSPVAKPRDQTQVFLKFIKEEEEPSANSQPATEPPATEPSV